MKEDDPPATIRKKNSNKSSGSKKVFLEVPKIIDPTIELWFLP